MTWMRLKDPLYNNWCWLGKWRGPNLRAKTC